MNHKSRIFNFAAGPSMLPLDVLKTASEQMLNYGGSGQSVMEMSHRAEEFETIIQEGERDLREILSIPENYKVLFLQGGATLQFSMIPLNLLRSSKKADYLITGSWAKKAAEEAGKFGDIQIVASSEEGHFTYIPEVRREDFRPDADYAHITWNNTIYGTRFSKAPDTGGIPLACDMSSSILSELADISQFGLIYAGAQKNIGPAGVTIVILREDLIGFAPKMAPAYLDYKAHADNGSMYNTPPCFSIYIAGEVFKKIKREGGLAAVEKANIQKAEKLYNYIDGSGLYKCPVEKKDRSRVNIVFLIGEPGMEQKFIEEAKKEGLYNLGGHRSIGGMRASIYNAMPMEGVDALIAFMKKFEAEA